MLSWSFILLPKLSTQQATATSMGAWRFTTFACMVAFVLTAQFARQPFFPKDKQT
jgi:hypothetical protein